jgi:cation transport ATPase
METQQDTNEETYYENESEENLQSAQQTVEEHPSTIQVYYDKEDENQKMRQPTPQQITTEESKTTLQEQQQQKSTEKTTQVKVQEDKSSFTHGLAVGLGIGCIGTFITLWISIFFIPILPSTITYEALLSIFIYPLIYLFAVGLIALTAAIVREYYSRKANI